jgi:hypothetical protein
VCRRWFTKGKRPPGVADQRYTFAYIYGAVEPNTDQAFALVLPEVNTPCMQLYIDAFSETIAADEHVALFIDQAGWHVANDLKFPDNITPLSLPPYSPEFNPVERVWEFLKERYLSHRLHDDYEAIVDAACIAWNKTKNETGRLTSLTWLPWEKASQKL